jgi:ABC-type dipeptide/oligopeptide/nickel transport system ATPase subunit
MYIVGGGLNMLKYKHLRLDQGKIERAKKILKAKTETEAMDKALERIVQEERESLRRRNLMKRIIQLRNSLGKMKEDSAEWIRLARKERTLSI